MPEPTVHPTKPVRVRFAPSPTGSLHIGGVRTALYNWVLARQTGGQFILRIEDTDQERLVPGAVEDIQASLKWMGLDWDEGPDIGGPYGPYVQSLRRPLYASVTKHLLDMGAAYECDCSPERLNILRERQRQQGLPPGYDNRCRSRPKSELDAARERGVPVVVRLKVPDHEEITFRDLVRGEITFDSARIQDFVIMKSDGMPTYHLAHVVDDHEMKITHVLRGDEWISTAPLHVLMNRALGYQRPEYVHLSVLLGQDKSKLSKRHGAASALEYRDNGYERDAVFNFLALLGWSPGSDKEVMSREEIVRLFSLDRINDSPAVFDNEKLDWMNGVYVRQMSPDALTDALLPVLENATEPPWDKVARPISRERVKSLLPMVHERLKKVNEGPEALGLFFEEEISPSNEAIIPKGMDAASTTSALKASLEVIAASTDFAAPSLEHGFRELATKLGLKPGQLFGAVRVAITARAVAPPLFDTMVALGRQKVMKRLDDAVRAVGRT